VKLDNTEIIARRQAELEARLDPRWQPETEMPVLSGGNLSYEMSARVQAIDCGGLGLMVLPARHLGLAATIDNHLHLLKRHLPYHESDHVLNMTYNILAGGLCLEDLELRRQDVGYMEALGAHRIPDPTTAGDFLRRFTAGNVEKLMDGLNEVRRDVWIAQSKNRRKLALIDVDGTIQETTGECKEGADFAYNGKWGYAPLVVSLANSQEVLYAVNRLANQPSHSDAVKWLDKAVDWAKNSGFAKSRLRGDTDFSLTANFDRWTGRGVEFVFGIDANPSFVKRAKALSEAAWRPLKRRMAPPLTTAPRMRPVNVKEEKVREREFINYRLVDEKIAEITYTPSKADGVYRMIILRKLINVEKGQQKLEDEIRYFFYVTNVSNEILKADAVVFESNARCHQENLIEQLKNGVRATQMPVGDLVSNWAYMVIGTLAWNLKIWLGLRLPENHGAHVLLKMEYRRFLNTAIRIPAQILRTGRRLVYRLLSLGGSWGRFILEASEWLRQRPKTA